MRFLVRSAALSSVLSIIPLALSGQAANDLIRARVEVARTMAGREHTSVFGQLCAIPIEAVGGTSVAMMRSRRPRHRGDGRNGGASR